jgi:glucose-6-phosphate isomerase
VLDLSSLLSRIDPANGIIDGAPRQERRLSDLRGIFADHDAYERMLAASNPLIYTVCSIEPGAGEGDLHYGVGMIMPGRVGDEYFMTKGHLHSWRPASEFYIGLRGKGMMLLESESGDESLALPLEPSGVVYVPGHTAHRTVNSGSEPLIYIGVYPARAGHDYGAIAERNFGQVIVEADGAPRVLGRDQYRARIERR